MYNVALGQNLPGQVVNLPREFTNVGRAHRGMLRGLGQAEQVSWARKNWKWLALGVGGLVAVGVVLKIVL